MNSVNPTPFLFPTFVPHNAAEVSQLQILHQIQQHAFTSNQALLFLTAFSLPFPVSWKLAIYHYLSTPPLTSIPLWLIVVIYFLGPFIFVGIIYWTVKYLPQSIQSITTFITSITFLFSKPVEDLTILELTFPHDTSKSAYATEQLYKALHSLTRKRRTLKERLLGFKKTFSLEIVASGDRKIRFICIVPKPDADTIHRALLSFLPAVQVKEIKDYLPVENNKLVTDRQVWWGFQEFTLSNIFAFPLASQKTLMEHDPMSYLTGNMTKLKKGEFMLMQLIATPVSKSTHRSLLNRVNDILCVIEKQADLSNLLNPLGPLQHLFFLPFLVLKFFLLLILDFLFFPLWVFLFVVTFGRTRLFPFLSPNKNYKSVALTPRQQEQHQAIYGKLSDYLFETSTRFLTVTATQEENRRRMDGLVAALSGFSSPYQSLIGKGDSLPVGKFNDYLNLFRLKYRLLSLRNNPVLSSSEISDLYHIPNMDLVHVEGLVKSKSSQLPAPSSMGRESANLDVVVGINTYGGEEIPIGFTANQRNMHMYVTGKTGMGKSTMIENMVLQDIENGKGICVIDAHGDMINHILTLIPTHRKNDVVYVNPVDKDFPPGLNILKPNVSYKDIEEEYGDIARNVIELFMRITPEKHWGQRMEHILRNSVLTALQITPGSPDTPYISLYAIQRLLTDDDYRKEVAKKIQDPVLKQFWDKEFRLIKRTQGEFIAPLTNKIGEFITDTLSRYIILQQNSTINISDIMDTGKILLVNLSKGRLGKERSTFFGTIFTSLIQLAINQRAQTPEIERRNFFVYIDEFQNFATPHFTELFSEARKYHVYFIASHQNIAQIDDPNIIKVIQGNVGAMVAFCGSPDDEKSILPFFSPEVTKGQIVNLAPYHFIMKVADVDCEDAFTAVTIPITQIGSKQVSDEIIRYSRKHYATSRDEVEKQMERLFTISPLAAKKRKPKPNTEADRNVGKGSRTAKRHVKIKT